MGIEAGKLRHRITIQAPGMAQDPVTGEIRPEWTDFASVWAEITDLSVKEYLAAQSAQSEVSTRVRIRFREGVNATMRIIHRGDIYNIHGVQRDPDSGIEWLTLPCSRGVNDG